MAEAIEAAATLRDRGLPVAATVLNGVRAAALRRRTTRPALEAAARRRRRAGARGGPRPRCAHLDHQRTDAAYRARLADEAGVPVIDLPRGRAAALRPGGARASSPTRSRRARRRGGGRVIDDLATRRLVVCCGAGGVGKTTVSAGVALRLAREGARTVVVTIDPARRLATRARHDRPLRRAAARARRRRPARRRRAVGPPARRQGDLRPAGGRYAPDDEARDRILDNRIYRHLSGTVAGAQEYMAVERLHELVEEGRLRAHRARHPARHQRPRLPRRPAAHHALHRGAGAAPAAAARRSRRAASAGG